jgi:non-ribosomal peptide synthetase component F
VAKRGGKGYGKIPLKDIEHAPWEDISVDLSGPWEATINNKKESFHTLTIIDVFTGWVEIIPIKMKTAAVVRRLIEQEWLRRYPRPNRILFDYGGEFDSQEFYTLCLIWHIIPVPITVRILEQMLLLKGCIKC